MRTRLVLFTLLCALLYATSALAQVSGLFLVDEGRRLDRGAIERAAQPLLNRGARVAVFAVDNGRAGRFDELLAEYGLARGDQVIDDMIAIFVSFNDRYSEIRYGDRWVPALDSTSTAIQSRQLNENLAANRPTQAFSETLGALDRAIAGGGNTGGSAAAPVAATSPASVGGCIGLLVLLIGGPAAWLAYSRRRTAQAARSGYEAARRNAGVAVADLGQAIQQMREQARFDAVSYDAAAAAELSELGQAAEQQFLQAKEQFDHADEAIRAKRTPTPDDYAATEPLFGQAAATAAAARALLDQATQRRNELDELNRQAPQALAQAQQALAAISEQVAVSGEFARPDRITRPIADMVAQIEALMAERRSAAAIATAAQIHEAIATLKAMLQRIADMREGLSAGRAGAERAAAQGYRVEEGQKLFADAELLVQQAAGSLEQGVAAALPLIEQAEQVRAAGVQRSGGLPALHQANQQRLERLRPALERLHGTIAEGKRAFDRVDEFAESTWSDIRGNGSEAEQAAEDAAGLIDEATHGNSIEVQGFIDAAADLDMVEERIAYAQTLIDTIIQRLKDLEAARNAARAEIAAAQADIDAGWAFIRSNDADIGKAPEEQLARAATALQTAQNELNNQRPDWLLVVRQAQEANRLADEALAGARDEFAAMESLRDKTARARQVAAAELQKTIQFATLHQGDLGNDAQRRLSELQAELQAADAAAAQISQAEEAYRAAALREAIQRFTNLEQRTQAVYADINEAFQRADQQRRRLADELRSAQHALDRAANLQAQAVAGGVGGRGAVLLNQARDTLRDAERQATDAGGMQQALNQATQARESANQAASIFEQDIAQYRDRNRSSGGDAFTGALIGSLLSGSRNTGGSRGSGGSRTRGGGGSWGRGGSSGGGGWGRSGGGRGGTSGGSGW